MDISDLLESAGPFRSRMATARAEIGDSVVWYRYDILANLGHLNTLLHGENRDLARLAGGLPVADIGAADGDLAFMLNLTLGWDVDLIDHGATNQNGLEGARLLREHLGSSVEINDIDLDSQFRLPRERYGLVFLLGILYHLQNPFYVLRHLRERADYCLLSTKVARYAGPAETHLADLPVAYLVGPTETNNDPTNYWMFSPTGLERIVNRAGWSVVERLAVGAVDRSDPYSPDRDERMLLLLQSSPSASEVPSAEGAVAVAPRESAPSAIEADSARDRAALQAELESLRRELSAANEQAAALRNMKVVRWTAMPRRLVYRWRAARR